MPRCRCSLPDMRRLRFWSGDESRQQLVHESKRPHTAAFLLTVCLKTLRHALFRAILSEDMKRAIQLLAIGAACYTGRGQTTNNQPSTNAVATAQGAATNTSEIAELRAEVAALKQHIAALTATLQRAQQAQSQASHAQQQQPTPQALVPLQWHRTSNGGWFLGPPVSGASPSQNEVPSNTQLAAIVRNAPGRVVGITVAPPRLGVPSFAHIAADGSVYYSLAPARGNF